MCGIAGFWSKDEALIRDAEPIVGAMTRMLHHRGPDGEGLWTDQFAGLALGHRRLSIIDLSDHGTQPMISHSGRFVIVFNGEIYNYGALRRALPEDIPWRGHSDTEVMLAAFEHWGLDRSLEAFNGMFAFALWDRQSHTLTLSRDRMGIKPLYVGQHGKGLYFGSELKALWPCPLFDDTLNANALDEMIRFNSVQGAQSVYAAVRRLAPGQYMHFDAPDTCPSIVTYWDVGQVAREQQAHPLEDTVEGVIDRLEETLQQAVTRRLVADVPVGAFLSGGVDSSLVVALMQAASPKPVKTFSIGFEEVAFDESGHARAVAQHLGTHHTEWIVTPADVQAVIPTLPSMYDEPFADSSQVPTYLVAQLARQHVTVSLSGDGGDELFAGYNRHVWGPTLWRVLRHLPLVLRKGIAQALVAPSPKAWDRLYDVLSPVLPRALQLRLVGEKAHKLAHVLASPTLGGLFERLMSQWRGQGTGIVHGVRQHQDALLMGADASLDEVQRLMLLDQQRYLPNDILTKIDRASMAVALEARVPLLDHQVVELAWQIPTSLKIREGMGKWILRQVLDRYVPRTLVERPKMGFTLPIQDWLRGSLRDWGEALLDTQALRASGMLDVQRIRQYWQEHLSEERNWQHALWNVLMFQAWYLHQRDRRAGANTTGQTPMSGRVSPS